MEIVFIVVLVLAVFSAVAAWLNTQTIIRELGEIKAKLGIEEKGKPSFLDKDFDKE